MQRLDDIPDAAAWTLVSIQGLHRFYRGRSEEVVASWMTREDRDLAIADNRAYVAAALEGVPHDDRTASCIWASRRAWPWRSAPPSALRGQARR